MKRVLTVVVAAALATIWGAGTALALPAWTVEIAPMPGGAVTGILQDVACVTERRCVAVGHSDDGTTESGYVLRGSGTTWAVEATPTLPADSSYLVGVDCASAKACMAVGFYKGAAGGPYRAHALRFKGNGWQASAMESPGLSNNGATQALDVSCASQSSCVAVGRYDNGTRHVGLVERWTGSSWVTQTFAEPLGSESSELYGVDCVSADSCVAVGVYSTPTEWSIPWAMRWDGATWSNTDAAVGPAGPLAALHAVSCTAADACTAVGVTSDGSTNADTLAMRWDGSAWTVQPTPPSLAGGDVELLVDVSCARTTSCVAVGFAESSDAGNLVMLALHWEDGQWTIDETQPISGATEAIFTGVSCSGRISCSAVGWAADEVERKPIAGHYA